MRSKWGLQLLLVFSGFCTSAVTGEAAPGDVTNEAGGLGSSKSKVEYDLEEQHGCQVHRRICFDLERFIVSDSRKQPGQGFQPGTLMDVTAWYNIPGYTDYVKGTKMEYETPIFRGRTQGDPPDILNPVYSNASVPLVWWPMWGNNPGDFFIASLAPLHRLLSSGLVEDNLKFVPVTDGQMLPLFYHLWLAPFTKHKVETLDEISARPGQGECGYKKPRCFKKALLCNLHNWWRPSPSLKNGQPWWIGLRPYTLGQQLAQYWEQPNKVDEAVQRGLIPAAPPDMLHSKLSRPRALPLKDPRAPSQKDVLVTFIDRKHKRRIRNLADVLSSCNTWLPKHKEGARVTCVGVNVDDSSKWVHHLPIFRNTSILVGMHGAGLMNSYFQRDGTAYVEMFPCRTGTEHTFASFRDPHRIEAKIMGMTLFIKNQTLCYPYQPKSQGEGKEDIEWGWGSIVHELMDRDQDVELSWPVLREAFERLLALDGDTQLYSMMLEKKASFFDIDM